MKNFLFRTLEVFDLLIIILVLERDGKLNELDERAADLLDDAKEFESTTQKVENKFKWENAKMKIIIGTI